MRRFAVAAGVAATLALTVAGCGGSPSSSGSDPNRDTQAQTTESTVPSVTVVEAKGANAAPNQASQAFYESSQEAADAFSEWWRYELQSTDDVARGVQQAYIDGIAACAMRAQGRMPDTAVNVLAQMGWTKGGAAAVYAAAVRSLCEQYDFGLAASDGTIAGYKTYFDQQVNLSHPLVLQAMRPFGLRKQPNHIDVGWFGKYTCAYLQSTGTSVGLLTYLVTKGSWMALASETRQLAQAAAKAVVTHMCPGYMDKVGAW